MPVEEYSLLQKKIFFPSQFLLAFYRLDWLESDGIGKGRSKKFVTNSWYNGKESAGQMPALSNGQMPAHAYWVADRFHGIKVALITSFRHLIFICSIRARSAQTQTFQTTIIGICHCDYFLFCSIQIFCRIRILFSVEAWALGQI